MSRAVGPHRMRWLNLPNLLTFARLPLTPVVVWAILQRRFATALLTLFVAGLTDVLDGMVARLCGLQTRLGAYLDPIADKLLLTASYLALGAAAVAPWWLVWLVLGRDLLILLMAAGALLFTPIRDFPPSVWGKLSTVVQVVAAVALLAGRAAPIAILERSGPGFVWLTAAATAWSGLHYVCQGLKRLRATA